MMKYIRRVIEEKERSAEQLQQSALYVESVKDLPSHSSGIKHAVEAMPPYFRKHAKKAHINRILREILTLWNFALAAHRLVFRGRRKKKASVIYYWPERWPPRIGAGRSNSRYWQVADLTEMQFQWAVDFEPLLAKLKKKLKALVHAEHGQDKSFAFHEHIDYEDFVEHMPQTSIYVPAGVPFVVLPFAFLHEDGP